MPYNANEHEQAILKYWDKIKAFEKSVNSLPETKPYVFYDGPPFATGLPHYGHILSSVVKDVVSRYWTMKGYRVRRRWGWDCHGLPIENLIEKELKISGKKQIEEMGVEKFNEACLAKVLLYTKDWKKMVNRIGRWVEFDNAYKTMDPTYMESVWWALKTIWDKGLIYESRKVLMYCPRCETPVAKAEVAMDDSYRDITEEAVIVKFKVKIKPENFKIKLPEQTYILAWTTTPWTLPGNVALAVNNDITYVLAQMKATDEYLILAKDRVKTVFGDKKYTIAREMKGLDLVGLEYEPLFEIGAVKESNKRGWYVAAADFVTTEEGAGVVHVAVIYGEDDYNLGVKIDLPMVPLLDDKGVFNSLAPAFIQGQYFKSAESEIKKNLKNRGLLFKKDQHTHSYPHCWRCDTQLFYNAISAWFIDIQSIKERLIKLNEKINWYPEHLKHGRFLNILETAPDWNISRNRYWATPLPFWKCENKEQSTKNQEQKICQNLVCVGSVRELKQKAVNFAEVYKIDNVAEMDLHKHLVDKIKLRCEECGGEMSRVPEVIDCWVESAAMPFAEFHYPFANQETFKKRFPGQYIAEYIAQTRAWFYYMHVMATLLFDNISFENCVTTGTILNEKGEKLSKSKQNYTDPWVIIEQYGADAMRYYLMTSVVMSADNLFFNDREVKDIYNKVINILWNVVTFYKMYTQENQESEISFRPELKPKGNQRSNNILDKWILAKLQALVKTVTENMDRYDTIKAGRPIKDFIDELSTWYLRRSRDRFKGENEADRQQALATLRETLLILAKVMAPFTPFMAEKIYQELRNENNDEAWPASVHLEVWPESDMSLVDQKIMVEMDVARQLVELILSARAEVGIKIRQPLSVVEFENYSNLESNPQLARIIKEETNIKVISFKKPMVKSSQKWIIKESGELKVGLNIEITEDLRAAGLAREIIRKINQMRKEAGLTIKDLVSVSFETEDEMLSAVIIEYMDEIKQGVLAVDIARTPGGVEVEIDGRKAKINVIKL